MTLRKRRPGLVYPTWEDWHYVGATDEPTFGTDWTNVGTPWPAMAFRQREAGVVDIIGTLNVGASASGPVFELPIGYRPSEQAFMPYIRQRSGTKSGQLLVVNDAGEVRPNDVVSGDYAYIAGSFFIDTAAP